MAAGIVEIRTTFGSQAEAEACGQALVADRLAACVQIDGPVTSCYRWQGRVESAVEWRCTCKTTSDRAAECVAGIEARHSYEIPEIIVADVVASVAYATWVQTSVAAD